MTRVYIVRFYTPKENKDRLEDGNKYTYTVQKLNIADSDIKDIIDSLDRTVVLFYSDVTSTWIVQKQTSYTYTDPNKKEHTIDLPPGTRITTQKPDSSPWVTFPFEYFESLRTIAYSYRFTDIKPNPKQVKSHKLLIPATSLYINRRGNQALRSIKGGPKKALQAFLEEIKTLFTDFKNTYPKSVEPEIVPINTLLEALNPKRKKDDKSLDFIESKHVSMEALSDLLKTVYPYCFDKTTGMPKISAESFLHYEKSCDICENLVENPTIQIPRNTIHETLDNHHYYPSDDTLKRIADTIQRLKQKEDVYSKEKEDYRSSIKIISQTVCLAYTLFEFALASLIKNNGGKPDLKALYTKGNPDGYDNGSKIVASIIWTILLGPKDILKNIDYNLFTLSKDTPIPEKDVPLLKRLGLKLITRTRKNGEVVTESPEPIWKSVMHTLFNHYDLFSGRHNLKSKFISLSPAPQFPVEVYFLICANDFFSPSPTNLITYEDDSAFRKKQAEASKEAQPEPPRAIPVPVSASGDNRPWNMQHLFCMLLGGSSSPP